MASIMYNLFVRRRNWIDYGKCCSRSVSRHSGGNVRLRNYRRRMVRKLVN